MAQLPAGTVTFMFTDIEGSTELLRDLGRATYERLQDEHAAILRAAASQSGGVEIRTEGDAFFIVFPTAPGALRAAISAQRGLAAHPWPDDGVIRVRIGLHTGEGALGGDDYVGIDVNRAARIAAAGHGGQIVVSEATRSLVADDVPGGATIRDLGLHGLKGLDPERLHDLAIDGLDADFPPLRAPGPRRTNLPARRTSFVGRGRDIAEVDALLGKTRLLTLTGPGGTGKTRLALEVASEQLERFPDGVFFVDLSPLTDPGLVIPAIARVLKVREAPGGGDLAEKLLQHLRELTVLLVLDNFEHLVDGSPVVGDLLDAAPGLTVLASSRIALQLSGEREHPVAPLDLPEQGWRGDATQIGRSGSVRLFVDRARSVRPDFALVDANAAAIAEIVRSLDGLPLALELAASRLRALDPATLAERLKHRLLLTDGRRDRPERHRTLEATIRWSYDMLEPHDRRLFARLSVFAGGWTLDAAEAVCGGDGIDVLEGISTLVDDSLVGRRELTDGSLRFAMLDTIREYAAARFAAADQSERVLVERRHAEWFRDLAEEAEPHLTDEHQLEWLESLEREQDNIRAALDRAARSDDPTDVANGLRTAASIWRFWQQRVALSEGRAWLERLMSLPSARERDGVRVRALGALGGIAYWLKEYDAMQTLYEEAVDIARELGDPRLLSRALLDLSFVSSMEGRPAEGEPFLHEALRVADETDLAIRAELWAGIGFIRLFSGEAARAAEPIERGVALQREAGEWLPLCNNLIALAGVKFALGDIGAAEAHVDEAIAIAAGSSNPIALASVLPARAILANHEGRHRLTATLLGAASRLERDYELRFPEIGMALFGDPAVEARAALGDEAYDLASAEGQAMVLEEVVELVSDPHPQVLGSTGSSQRT